MFKGTVIAQIIAVIGSIFLAKIYGSEAYGIFGLYISISSVLIILNNFQLDKLIVTVKTEYESKNLMNSLFLISFLTASVTIVIYYLLSLVFVLSFFKINIILFSSFASILLSFNKIHESFFTFSKKFIPISNAKIFIAILNISFQLVLFYEFKLMGLIFGNIISIFLIAIYYFIKNNKSLNKINLLQLKKSIHKNNTIIKYIFPSTLINSLAINLVPILIATFFSLKDAGVYFLSIKILAIPLFLISSSISQVYYQKSSEMLYHSREKLFFLTKKIVSSNLLIMLIFIILINTIGIYFLELFFDKSWDNLRLYTFILSFLILARSSFNPISNIIIVLNKNHIGLLFNIYLLAVNIIAIYLGYKSDSLKNTIIILSIFGSLGYIVLLTFFMQKLKKLEHDN